MLYKILLAFGIALLIPTLIGKVVFAGQDWNWNGNENTSCNENGNLNENTNSNQNANVSVNENANTNTAVNQNTNQVTNVNLNTNTPANVNTSPPVVEPTITSPPPVVAVVAPPPPPVVKPRVKSAQPELAKTGPSRMDWFLIISGALCLIVGVNTWVAFRKENKSIR